MAELTLDPPGRATGRAPLVLGTAGHAVNDAYTAFLPALLPLFHAELGLDEAALAALVAIFALSASLPGPLLGRLSDRFGESAVTAGSVLFSAVLLSLLAAAPSVPLLFGLVAVAGFGSAAIHPAGSMLVRRGASRPELAVALFAAGGMLGYAAGPTFLAQARALAGPALPAVLPIPGLAAAAAILLLAPRGGGDRPAGRTAPAPRFDWRLALGPVGLVTLAAAFAFLPVAATLNGLPLFLMERHGLAATDPAIAGTLGTFSLAAAGGGIGVGLLAARLPRRWLLAGVLAASVPVFLALVWLQPGTALFAVALAAAGALGYAATPLLVVAAQDLAPQAGATAAGMVFGLGSALAGLLYLGVGALQAQIGVGPGLALAFLAPALAAAISLAALRSAPAGASVPASAIETLCACAAASGAGVVPCASACSPSCKGDPQNA